VIQRYAAYSSISPVHSDNSSPLLEFVRPLGAYSDIGAPFHRHHIASNGAPFDSKACLMFGALVERASDARLNPTGIVVLETPGDSTRYTSS
jgi:hypothetical protein